MLSKEWYGCLDKEELLAGIEEVPCVVIHMFEKANHMVMYINHM